MRDRTDSVDRPREGWPWFVWKHDAGAYVLKLRGGPRERSALREWVEEVRRRAVEVALDVARRAEEPGVDAVALMAEANAANAAAVEVAEATAGYLVAWSWADPDLELEARSAYDRGEFAGHGDAKIRCGLAAVEELLDAGVAWEAIEDLARALMPVLRRGTVDRREVAEVRPFSLEPTEP